MVAAPRDRGLVRAHRPRWRHPGRALRASPPARSGRLGQRHAVAGATDRRTAAAGARANNDGNTKGALELYDKVLSEDPSNPAALAYAGYLQWNVGSASHVASLVRIGRSEIETAGQGLTQLRPGPSLLRARARRTRTTTTRQRWPSSTTSWPTARRRPSCPRWSPSSPAPTRRPGCPCRRSSRAAPRRLPPTSTP